MIRQFQTERSKPGRLLILTIVFVGTAFVCVPSVHGRGNNEQPSPGDQQSQSESEGTRIEITDPTESNQEEPTSDPSDQGSVDPEATNATDDLPGAAWFLGTHNATDASVVGSEITATLSGSNLSPLGIDITAFGNMLVMYAETPQVNTNRWGLVQLKMGDELQERINGLIADRQIPVGLSVQDETVTFLTLEYAFQYSKWKLESLEGTDEQIGQYIADLNKESYRVLDFAREGESYVFLSGFFEGSLYEYRLRSIPEDASPSVVTSAIQDLVAQGYLPVGIAAREGDVLQVLFERQVETGQ